MGKTRQRTLLCVLCAIFVAATYFCLGYAVCAGVPQVTEAVAQATVSGDGSAFTHDSLVEGASATREYSFGSHDEAAYYDVIAHMNRDNETPYADASLDELKRAPEEYTVTPDALAHLDDVYDVSSRLMFPVIGIALMAGFLLMAAYNMFGSSAVAKSLLWGGGAMLALIAVLAIWAAASFDSLFALMHSLLFADGTWTFSPDSLLITMLPEGFWIGMAFVWGAVTALLSAISVAAALVLSRRQSKDGNRS